MKLMLLSGYDIKVMYIWRWSESYSAALFDPMNCSSSGSYIHGISQVRIEYWSGLLFPSPLGVLISLFSGLKAEDQVVVYLECGLFFWFSRLNTFLINTPTRGWRWGREMRRLIGLFFLFTSTQIKFLVVQKTGVIGNIYLFLPVLCKCMVEEREPSKRFSSLDFIYLQSPLICSSSNMAPIPVNMEINAYSISIWAVANTWLFSELQ